MRLVVSLTALALLALSACQKSPEPPQTAQAATAAPTASPTAFSKARLPDDQAGRIIARAIEATGGWDEWEKHRNVAFVSTLSIFDRIGTVMSETILLQRSPLHDGMQTRVDSIGLSEEVILGFDGQTTWMLHDGKAVSDPLRTAFTRFNAVSSHYWFGLPFILAESPVRLSYAGAETDGGREFQKVRVEFPDAEAAPADWLVLYVDMSDGLIARVLCHVTVEFLRHPLWLAKLREYRDWEGIKKERRRTFFPADEKGTIVGNMAAEQLIEHVRFDNDFPQDLFTRPLAAGGGSPAA